MTNASFLPRRSTFPDRPPSLLIAEFLVGGGWRTECGDEPPTPSLLAEGAAMLAALANDALAAGFSPWVLIDGRLPLPESFVVGAAWRTILVSSAHEEREHLEKLAATADWTIVLAPETAGWLARRADWVDAAGGRRLSSPAADLTIAGDKQFTAERLKKFGVPAPRGGLIAPGQAFPPHIRFPLVLKPRDGAGSTETFVVADDSIAQQILARFSGPIRWEEFCIGQTVSVACLCGPTPAIRDNPSEDSLRIVPLPACRQDVHFDASPGSQNLRYHGGSLPLPPELDVRARRLAERAVRTLDAPLGWLGVDLILGNAADGSADAVIEINPRYTTSLVGLRASLDANLLEAAIQIAEGRPSPALDEALSRPPRPVEFDPDGSVRVLSPAE